MINTSVVDFVIPRPCLFCSKERRGEDNFVGSQQETLSRKKPQGKLNIMRPENAQGRTCEVKQETGRLLEEEAKVDGNTVHKRLGKEKRKKITPFSLKRGYLSSDCLSLVVKS